MKSEMLPRPFEPCEYEVGCGHEAFASLTLSVRRVKICRNHYHSHFAGTARVFCERNELRTVVQMRDFIRVKLADFLTKQPSKSWAPRIIERASRGEQFMPLALDYAKEVSRRKVVEREPGQDEEELIA